MRAADQIDERLMEVAAAGDVDLRERLPLVGGGGAVLRELLRLESRDHRGQRVREVNLVRAVVLAEIVGAGGGSVR